jgi:hypothetical protein
MQDCVYASLNTEGLRLWCAVVHTVAHCGAYHISAISAIFSAPFFRASSVNYRHKQQIFHLLLVSGLDSLNVIEI